MTKSDRRFFVVTPVLNGASYLSDALASIDSQSHHDWVHYVVDGGSTDETLEIVRKSIRTEPRRRLIQGTDRGLYDAVFKGFEATETHGLQDGDICLWLNADDLLAPWAFATMQAAFDMHDADWVTGQPGRWDAQGRLVLVEPNGWYPRWFIAHGWFSFACLGSIQQESTFFTVRILRKLSSQAQETIRKTRLAGDFLLWREFARLCPLHVAPTVISGFRMHGANLSARAMESYLEELRMNGAVLLPPIIRKCCRLSYQIMAAVIAVLNARRPITTVKR